MKRGLILVSLVLVMLVVACSPQQAPADDDSPSGVTGGATADQAPQEEVEDIEQGVEEVGDVDEELNLSELDQLDDDLDDFDW